jgi:hypothetical protein
MTEAAAIKEAAVINEEMLDALLVIHRVASRALSAEERVGQRMQGDPRGEINGVLVQMLVIEKLARAGLPKEARELLDLAVAKGETAAIRAEGAEVSLISFRGLTRFVSVLIIAPWHRGAFLPLGRSTKWAAAPP